MRPTLRPLAPAAAAILFGVACSQQPAPSPSPVPAGDQTAARGPARSDSGPSDSPAGGRQAGGAGGGGANAELAEPNPRPYGRVGTREGDTREDRESGG